MENYKGDLEQDIKIVMCIPPQVCPHGFHPWESFLVWLKMPAKTEWSEIGADTREWTRDCLKNGYFQLANFKDQLKRLRSSDGVLHGDGWYEAASRIISASEEVMREAMKATY